VFTTGQTSLLSINNLVTVLSCPPRQQASALSEERDCGCCLAQHQGDENMLGIIAAVLIVLWLLGFFAFHVTSGFIHIALVVGLILFVLHFMRRSTASA
jgi:hypothetical protein